jgi:hypothetical protein
MTDTKPRPRPTDLFSQLERKRSEELERLEPEESSSSSGGGAEQLKEELSEAVRRTKEEWSNR